MTFPHLGVDLKVLQVRNGRFNVEIEREDGFGNVYPADHFEIAMEIVKREIEMAKTKLAIHG